MGQLKVKIGEAGECVHSVSRLSFPRRRESRHCAHEALPTLRSADQESGFSAAGGPAADSGMTEELSRLKAAPTVLGFSLA